MHMLTILRLEAVPFKYRVESGTTHIHTHQPNRARLVLNFRQSARAARCPCCLERDYSSTCAVSPADLPPTRR
eukprot:6198421-Pleurochrysis_carterae.AAC.5